MGVSRRPHTRSDLRAGCSSSDTMKTLSLLVTFLSIAIYSSDGLVCEKVTCPGDSLMCDVNYTYTYSPNKKITEVVCFNAHRRVVHREKYDEPNDEPILLPIVECNGYKCKQGAYNCSTLTTPFLKADPPKETTHLTCRDDRGRVIEENDFVRILTPPEASGKTPPTCEGYRCPLGSRSCVYNTIIKRVDPDPTKKTAHIVCYDIKNKKTIEVDLDL